MSISGQYKTSFQKKSLLTSLMNRRGYGCKDSVDFHFSSTSKALSKEKTRISLM